VSRLPLLALFSANAISLTGNVLTLIAVPWFVLQTTGSAVKTGLTAFFAALAVVVAAFLGGVVVDRLGYKRASIVADLASGTAVALYRCSTPRSGWRSGNCSRWSSSATCATRLGPPHVRPSSPMSRVPPRCRWSKLRHPRRRSSVVRACWARR